MQLPPNESDVLRYHVTNRSRRKYYLQGISLLLGPLDNVHQLPEGNPQTLILDVFPSVPWSRLKIVENSLTLSMKGGICFLEPR